MNKTPFKPLSYRNAADQLRVSHRRGLLVPFVGAGLCVPRLRLWPSLVGALAREADINDLQLEKAPTDQQLIVASERIVWRLRAKGHVLADAVSRALQTPTHGPAVTPPGVRALASVWWPLVLTTNYDSLLLDHFNETHKRLKNQNETMAAVGRNTADCHTVLASLSLPMRPLLWALQGFLGASVNGSDLRQEIVLGHEQYRQVTFANAGFRAAFSEVYRNRSLFFVGAGLGEDYFRGLFGESLVRLGSNQHAHCALINSKDLDHVSPWFMHTRLNIVVLTYDDPPGGLPYSGFARCLEHVADILAAPPRGARRFWVGNRNAVCVDIEPTSLPNRGTAKHWVVGSAGMRASGEPRISGDVPKSVSTKWRTVARTPDLMKGNRTGALLAIARTRHTRGHAARDLRKVADVTERALQVASDGGASTVSFMLLAASVHARRWPRIFSLVQMLRGIQRFAQRQVRSSRRRPLRIVIHDTAAARTVEDDPERSVWHAIETGRLDPAEVLQTTALRIFVEVDLADTVVRSALYVDDDKTIRQVADYFQVPNDWLASLEPNPMPNQDPFLTDFGMTLLSAGIVPGSILRFSRARSGATSAPLERQLRPRR